MGTRERVAAGARVQAQARRSDRLDWHRTLQVCQLAGVEIAPFSAPTPAQEDVGRRLHAALANHYTFAVVLIPTFAQIRLQHRWLRLLELQEQRIVYRPAFEQHD